MTRVEIPHLEIESLAEFDRYVVSTNRLEHCTIQSIDLTKREETLESVDPSGALFLGCTMSDDMEDSLRERGALVFPRLPEVPFNPYQSHLYSAIELYDSIAAGKRYADSFDAKVYAWFHALGKNPPIPATLAMSLHDHAITDALDELWAEHDPRWTVGIMGGHALKRDDDGYIGAARLSSQLAMAGYTIMTGGGPGAMEAANLGAYLAGQYATLSHALDTLSTVPSYHEESTAWAAVALEVVQTTRASGHSIGVPTWFYGHEPPNAFGTKIAKYFSNALREDILLDRCRGGLVYLPGAAGTVQEVFQAATRNYYALDDSQLSPMILVGVSHWTKHLPVWPLLHALGQQRRMSTIVHLVDTIDEAVEIIMESRS